MTDVNANTNAKLNAEAPGSSGGQGNTPVSNGLENIIAADTVLSRVDGERGELLIRGLPLERVAGVIPFEGTCRLLWTGATSDSGDSGDSARPTPSPGSTGRHEELRHQLGLARARAFQFLPRLGTALERPDAMEALRAAAAQLAEPAVLQEDGDSAGGIVRKNVQIVAAIAVFTAAWARGHRASGALSPVEPDPELGHAEDYLRMIAGAAAQSEPNWGRRVSALDSYLSTVAEHGMNASTFAARVVASTGSDPVSAVVAALCALKGPLHGGAPGPVLDMIDSIGEPAAARAWLEAEISAGRRIMGLGHRVYRVRDPRAAVLEAALLELREDGFETPRLALARAIEHEARTLLRERHPDRPLDTNVEFYTALLLDGIGLDRRLFSPTFAVARVTGWLAHIDEQRRSGRLIRPRSRYVGPLPEAA